MPKTGLGFVKLDECVYDVSLPLKVGPHAHHMGTTRMATSPDFGVVDENCKVFGTNNLYVTGSSVFATAGASNPTMPLLQLALRLADHLNHQMGPVEGRYSERNYTVVMGEQLQRGCHSKVLTTTMVHLVLVPM